MPLPTSNSSTAPTLDAVAPELRSAVGEQLLQLLARQGRRVPWPVGLAAVLIAAMAARASHGEALGFGIAWVALVFAVLGLRAWGLGRLPQMQEVPLSRRLQWAVGLSLLNGVVFSASLGFAPWLGDYQRMIQSLVLLGLCAGAVATTAGHPRVLGVFLIPLSLANALSWVTGSGGVHAVAWVDWVLGGLILGVAVILAGLGRDTWRVFVESVQIRQQQARSNQQLRAALAQAESAMQAKTRFLAAASHDLRQPMHTLGLLGAALQRRPLDEGTAEIGRQMNVALEALSQQMDALLDISKLDAQVVPVSSTVFALAPWLTRLVRELEPAAAAKGLALTLDCPAPVFVDSDPLLLERVLRNLLDNALKYTARGFVAVKVERDGDIWRVIVQDSGCGIPAEEQPRVFEEFYQVGNPARDRARGLGLGLSIVSRLCDLLDLTLSVDSRPGEGSCFSLGISAASAPPQGVAAPRAAETGALLPAPLHVLVLDDEGPVREAMRTLLRSHGCEVTLAASTREGLLKSMSRRPDLLLSDLRLGEGDAGIAAVRSLRGALPGLPALLISGDTAPERLREAHEAGLTLLHKPLQEAQLLAAMREALSPSRSADAVQAAR